MNSAVIVPADEFRECTPKMPFIPDQQSVETLAAKRPYQPLDVCRRIGRPIWDGDPPNAHLNPEPYIVCRSTRNSLPSALHSNRSTKLSELSVVVMEVDLDGEVLRGIEDLHEEGESTGARRRGGAEDRFRNRRDEFMK